MSGQSTWLYRYEPLWPSPIKPTRITPPSRMSEETGACYQGVYFFLPRFDVFFLVRLVLILSSGKKFVFGYSTNESSPI